ncbi:hypothetical protein U1Q18_027446, partial [Sarracenia purpurea var. burkii]
TRSMIRSLKRQIKEDSTSARTKKRSRENSSKGVSASSPIDSPLATPPPGFFLLKPSSPTHPSVEQTDTTFHLPSLASTLKSTHQRINYIYRIVSNHAIKENILEEKLHYALREINEIKKSTQEMALKEIMAKLNIDQGYGEASSSQAEKMKNHS